MIHFEPGGVLYRVVHSINKDGDTVQSTFYIMDYTKTPPELVVMVKNDTFSTADPDATLTSVASDWTTAHA